MLATRKYQRNKAKVTRGRELCDSTNNRQPWPVCCCCNASMTQFLPFSLSPPFFLFFSFQRRFPFAPLIHASSPSLSPPLPSCWRQSWTAFSLVHPEAQEPPYRWILPPEDLSAVLRFFQHFSCLADVAVLIIIVVVIAIIGFAIMIYLFNYQLTF